MPTPTESARTHEFRWCRRLGWSDDMWFVAPVITETDGRTWIPAGGLGHEHHEGDEPDLEWGERIPDSDTIRAMREMAATPSACPDSDGTPLCVHCGCVLGKHAEPHRPDCPYLRSQEQRPPAFGAFDASEETAESASRAIVIAEVPQEMWDAMSEAQREKCRRFTREVCGEEKADAPTPRP